MKHLLSLIIAIALLAACSEPAPDPRLLRAESLIDSLPDTALAIVENIDTSRLHGERNAALYGLLLTQARHKTDIIETDDSLINASLRFFNTNGPDQKTMLAHFYRAIILTSAGESRDALFEALQAEELAMKIGDEYWLARVYELIGDIYFEAYNMETYLKYAKKALAGFNATGFKMNSYYTSMQMAAAIDFNGDHKNAIKLIDSLSRLPIQDSITIGCVYEAYLRPYSALGEYEKAMSMHKKGYAYLGYYNDCFVDWADVAEIYLNLGYMDSALRCIEKIAVSKQGLSKNSDVNRVNYLVCKASGNYKLALEYLEKNHTYSLGIRRNALKQDLAFVERDFVSRKAEIEKLRVEKLNVLLISCLTIFLLILTFIVVIYNIRAKKRRGELESSILDAAAMKAELKELSSILSCRDSALASQRLLIDKLFKNNFTDIDKIASDYFGKMDSPASKIVLAEDIEKVLDDMRKPDKISEVRDIVNGCCEGIIDRIKSCLPKVKEPDLNMLAFICAGFSSKSICLFLDIKPMTYYQKRGRLLSKIDLLEEEDRNFIFKYISRH